MKANKTIVSPEICSFETKTSRYQQRMVAFACENTMKDLAQKLKLLHVSVEAVEVMKKVNALLENACAIPDEIAIPLEKLCYTLRNFIRQHDKSNKEGETDCKSFEESLILHLEEIEAPFFESYWSALYLESPPIALFCMVMKLPQDVQYTGTSTAWREYTQFLNFFKK